MPSASPKRRRSTPKPKPEGEGSLLEKGTLHFSIDGGFLTSHLRQLYREGRTNDALRTLQYVDGITAKDAWLLLTGKRKFVSHARGVELVEDDVEVLVYAAPTPPPPDACDDEDDVIPETELEDEEPAEPPPQPDLTMEADTGWLSPEGKLYPCDYWGHSDLAHRLKLSWRGHIHGVSGWIHVQDGHFRNPSPWHTDDEPSVDATQAQIDFIFDWCQKHGKEMPAWAMPEDQE